MKVKELKELLNKIPDDSNISMEGKDFPIQFKLPIYNEDYKAKYFEILEEVEDLRIFKSKIEDKRKLYKELKDNKHRMNYMKKDPNAIEGDFVSLYRTIEYDSNGNRNSMYIRSEEELLGYIKEIITKWKHLGACTLYIRHEGEEPRY